MRESEGLRGCPTEPAGQEGKEMAESSRVELSRDRYEAKDNGRDGNRETETGTERQRQEKRKLPVVRLRACDGTISRINAVRFKEGKHRESGITLEVFQEHEKKSYKKLPCPSRGLPQHFVVHECASTVPRFSRYCDRVLYERGVVSSLRNEITCQ